MPHGFTQLNPDGAWHMTGTTTTQMEQNPPITTAGTFVLRGELATLVDGAEVDIPITSLVLSVLN